MVDHFAHFSGFKKIHFLTFWGSCFSSLPPEICNMVFFPTKSYFLILSGPSLAVVKAIDDFHALLILFHCFCPTESICSVCLFAGFDEKEVKKDRLPSRGKMWQGSLCMSYEPLPLKGTCQPSNCILVTLPFHRTVHCTTKTDLCVRRAARPPR